MENKKSNKICFGRGFRKVDPSISAVGFNPAVREKELTIKVYMNIIMNRNKNSKSEQLTINKKSSGGKSL
jgi:hypothetical protein